MCCERTDSQTNRSTVVFLPLCVRVWGDEAAKEEILSAGVARRSLSAPSVSHALSQKEGEGGCSC